MLYLYRPYREQRQYLLLVFSHYLTFMELERQQPRR